MLIGHLSGRHRTVGALVGAGAFVALAVACGVSDEEATTTASTSIANTATTVTPNSDPTTQTTTAQPSSTRAATTPTSTTTSTTTTSTTTTSTTTSSTTTSTSVVPTTTVSPTRAISVPIPDGSFSAGPTDLYVLALDGDLELWAETLAAPPTRKTTVVDYPNPFGPVNEGSGPNVIDHVAGEINGSVVFGDCCEPISGTILAATAPDVASGITFGYTPSLSPTGDLLGAANDFGISQTSTGDSGAGLFGQLNVEPDGPYLNVADLTWTTNATATGDDDHLVLLGWTNDDGWSLYDVDRGTLELTKALELGISPVSTAPTTDVRFAGIGPDAEIVIAESNPTTTRLRYFAPTTLAELPQLERSLPPSATSIRVSTDDLMWVDDAVLYFLRGGTFEPVRLGGGVIAAWPP